MNHAKDLIGAIGQYYGKPYPMRMAQEIASRYSWISPQYKEALFDEAIRTFEPTSTRPIPDMAALQKAERNLPPPATLAPPALPGPDDLESERQPELMRKLSDELDRSTERDGEFNHEGRERLRAKVRKGNASRYERYWLRVIDDYGGDWAAAHAAIGDVDDVFHDE